MVKICGQRCLRDASHPTSPRVSGGETVITASNLLRVNKAGIAAITVNPMKPKPLPIKDFLEEGNG